MSREEKQFIEEIDHVCNCAAAVCAFILGCVAVEALVSGLVRL